jgi:hypothetical protein
MVCLVQERGSWDIFLKEYQQNPLFTIDKYLFRQAKTKNVKHQSGNEPVNANSKGNCKEEKTEENTNSNKGAEKMELHANYQLAGKS